MAARLDYRWHLRQVMAAREFFGVSPNASLDDLAEIADRYPVFRIEQ